MILIDHVLVLSEAPARLVLRSSELVPPYFISFLAKYASSSSLGIQAMQPRQPIQNTVFSLYSFKVSYC